MSETSDSQFRSKSQVKTQLISTQNREQQERVPLSQREKMQSQVPRDGKHYLYQSLQDSLDDMVTYKASIQQQLETIQLKIKESEEIRQRQYHNLLESQKSFSQISSRLQTEINNKNALLSKVQQTRLNCQSLQDECKIITGSLQRMVIQRENIKEAFQGDEEKCSHFEKELLSLQENQGHLHSLEKQILEVLERNDREKKELYDKKEALKSEIHKNIDELNGQLLQEDEEIETLTNQQTFRRTRAAKLIEMDIQLIQSLEERKRVQEKTKLELLQNKEEKEKTLLSIKHGNTEMEIIVQKKHQVEAELKKIKERYLMMQTKNEELKKDIASIKNDCQLKESALRKAITEQEDGLKEICIATDVHVQELAALRENNQRELAELISKLEETQNLVNMKQSQLSTKTDQKNKLLFVVHEIDEQFASEEGKESELERLIESLREEHNQRKQSLEEIQNDLQSKQNVQLEINEALLSELSKTQKIYEETNVKANEAVEKCSSMEEALAEYKEKVSNQEIQISYLETKYQDTKHRRQKHQNVSEENARFISEFIKQEEVLQGNILQEKDKNKQMVQKLAEELILVQNLHQEDQGCLEKIQKAKQTSEVKFQKLKSENNFMHSKITEKKEIIESLENDLLDLKNKNSELKEATGLSSHDTEERIRKYEEANIENAATIKEMETSLQEENRRLESIDLQIRNAIEDQNIKMNQERCIINETESLTTEMSSLIQKFQGDLDNEEICIRYLIDDSEKHEKEMHLLVLKLEKCQLKTSKHDENKNDTIRNIKRAEMCLEREEDGQARNLEEISRLSTRLIMLEKEAVLANNSEQIQDLLKQTMAARKACEDRSNEICAMTSNLRESRSKEMREQKAFQESTEHCQKLVDELSAKNNILEAMEARRDRLQKQLLLSETNLKQMQKEVSSLKKLNDRIFKKVAAHKSEKRKLLEQDDEKEPLQSKEAGNTTTFKKKALKTSDQTSPEDSVHLTPRSILKSSKTCTPQSIKSVSFSFNDSDSSVLIEPEDAEAIEKDPQSARQIMERRKQVQKNQKLNNKVQLAPEDI